MRNDTLTVRKRTGEGRRERSGKRKEGEMGKRNDGAKERRGDEGEFEIEITCPSGRRV
jgi:hypothetical protein